MPNVETGASKGFWTTLPGILTGTATTLAAITGLVAAVYQFHKPPDPAKVSTQASVAAEDFETITTQDGFVSVREAPSGGSAEKRRLRPGTAVTCQGLVKGQAVWDSVDWRYCPSVDGYIHSKLLIPKKNS